MSLFPRFNPATIDLLPHIGLIDKKTGELPLRSVAVEAQLTGYVASITSLLKYDNKSSGPAEVVFRFPIDDDYAVTGLEALIDGRKITAEIKEKEEARQDYDDAIASGFTAALGEETTGDIFSISLGNLPPNTEAEILLRMVCELPLDPDGGVCFTLPTVLKPRYTPPGQHPNPLDFVAYEASRATSPPVLDFKLEVTDSSSIADVTSTTHTITTQRVGENKIVTLQGQQQLIKDLVISVAYSDPHTPKALPEPGNPGLSQRSFMGSPAVMINFFPQFQTKRAACEFIFVIDRSGSMSGQYMKSAKETLLLFLRSIPPGCYFNVIGFGSRFTVMFAGSQEYNQLNLNTAVTETEKMFANLGGTELLKPLQHIYQQPLLPGLPRQVFVLTDGSVSNTSACIKEVKDHVSHTRVFTFGIGSGASSELVKGLAKAGNGTAEFIQSGERMQPKVIGSLKRALQPAVTDLDVTFDVPSGFEAFKAPAKAPVVFNGDKTTVYAVFKSKALSDEPLQSSLTGSATLRGYVLGQPIEHFIQFTIPAPSTDASAKFIHQLASKALISDWQTSDKDKKEITKLSIESSVISKHTAYIAVDESQDKPIEGGIKVWDVLAPQPQPQGIGFGGGAAFKQSFGLQRNTGPPFGLDGIDMLSAAPPPPSGGGIMLGGTAGASTGLRLGSLSAAPPPPSGGGMMRGGGGIMLGGTAGASTGLRLGSLSAAPPPPSGGGMIRGGGGIMLGGTAGASTGLRLGSLSAPPPPPSGGGLFQTASTGHADVFGALSNAPMGGGLGLDPPETQMNLFSGPPPAAPSGGGLFGHRAKPTSKSTNDAFSFSNAQPPPRAPGGLFGGPQQSAGGLGISGGSTQQPAGGLFGGPPQQSAGGLFGGPPRQSAGGLTLSGGPPQQSAGGFFGGPQQTSLGLSAAPTNQSTGGLFGDLSWGSQQSTGGLFGGPPSSGLSISNQGSLFKNRSSGAQAEGLTAILSLQQAEGYWQLPQIAATLNHSVSYLSTAGPSGCAENVWATVLILVYLELKFATQKDEWELVAMKGEMWLEDHAGSQLASFRAAATKFLSPTV